MDALNSEDAREERPTDRLRSVCIAVIFPNNKRSHTKVTTRFRETRTKKKTKNGYLCCIFKNGFIKYS